MKTATPLYTPEFFRVTVVFLLLMTTMTMLFLLPILVEELGGGAFDIGLVMGVMPIAGVASRFAWGRWLDRVGRKKVLLLSALINTVVLVLFLTVESVGLWLVTLRVLQGVAWGGFVAALWTIVADISPPERLAESLGNFGIAGMAALAIGPWGGEAIIRVYGFGGLFIGAGILSLLGLLLSLRLTESRPDLSCDSETPSLKELLKGGVGVVFLITIAFAASRSAFGSFFAEYSRLQGIASIGLYSLIYSATTIFFRVAAGRLSDRIGRVKVLGPALLLFGVGIGLIAFIRSMPLFIVSAFLCGLGHCYLYPVLNALVVQKVHHCARGTATSLYTSSFDLGLGVSALLWGVVAQWGGYHLMYVLAGCVSLAGILAIGRLFRDE